MAWVQDTFGLIGQTLDGKFRVERAVAEGGFAIVYAGTHVSLRRPIAIKVLRRPPQLTQAQYEGFIETAENPEFTAHIVDAISRAPNRDELSGQTLIAAEIARELGVTDRGNERPSYREMLGSPRPKNPAAVY